MDRLDESLIREYMHLNSKHQRIMARLARIKKAFWQQSFMRSPLDVDEVGNPNRIVRFDKQINAILDMESLANEVSQEIVFKAHLWARYINGLSTGNKAYLLAKYKRGEQVPLHLEIEQSAVNECNQVEEATALRFGLADERAVDVSNDVNQMMNQVLGIIS